MSDTKVDASEDIDFLRGKINSLSIRGDSAGCIQLIEENLRTLYEKERWPDVFFAVLRTYQRCMGLTGQLDSMERRLTGQLQKNGVPVVFAGLLRLSDASITWNADYFKNLVLVSERRGDYESALSYCDILIKLDPLNSSALVLRGWILDDLGRHDAAVRMYEQALAANETNHTARSSLAKHYAESNPSLALEYIDRAIELSPAEGGYYDTKAKILRRTGDIDGAVRCYDLAISASPYTADYPYQKGELLLQTGKEIAAIAQYRKALALNGEHIPTLWRLAALYRESQPEMALMYLNTIATLKPDDTEVLIQRGNLLGKLGRTEAAAEQFKDLIDADPERHEALAGYANLILLNDPENALFYYDKAIALSPDIADYHMGRARALELLGMDAQAIKEYRKTVALDKTNSRALARLATLISATKPREAVELYTKAIGLMPENAFYYAAKGELLMNLPNCRTEAIECFTGAVKYDPSNAKLHALLGRLLDEEGDGAAAAVHLKQAVSLDQTDPDAFYRLAKLLFPDGADLSLLHINSAISLDQGNGDYYFFKSQVLNHLGHDRQALEQLQKTLRADPKHAEALKEISEILSDDSPKVALMHINRAIELSPANGEYLCQRANILLSVGETDKAIEQYNSAIAVSPKRHEAVFGIGQCLAPDAKALAYFDKAIAINDKIALYHAEKGRLLSGIDKPEAALEAYERAISLDPENSGYLIRKAKLLETLGRTGEACVAYRGVLEVSADDIVALSRLGELLAEIAPEEAVEYLDRAIAIEPRQYMHHAWKGRALLALGERDFAAAEYQTAARLGGETAGTYYTLALLLRDKMPEIALGFALRAIDEGGGNADRYVLCGRIYETLEQVGAAVDSFKKAIAYSPSCHEANEEIARIFYSRNDPNMMQAADYALTQSPDCATCNMLMAKILNARADGRDADSILECVERVIASEPENIAAREMLIGLLAEKRAYMRLAVERIKLAGLKRKA